MGKTQRSVADGGNSLLGSLLFALGKVAGQRLVLESHLVPKDKPRTDTRYPCKREKYHWKIQHPMRLIKASQPNTQQNHACNSEKQHSWSIHITSFGLVRDPNDEFTRREAVGVERRVGRSLRHLALSGVEHCAILPRSRQ
jgi:hypothetical protein